MRRKTAVRLFGFTTYTVLVLTAACSGGNGKTTAEEAHTMTLRISSPAFADGKPIPPKYTCEGEDLSPPLQWDNAPKNTRTFALIVDDPDAPSGTWVHWVLYEIPARTTKLPEGVPPQKALENGARQGVNDFKRIGYGGPCPPPGDPHHYFFKLYALNAALNLKPGATMKELENAMEGHILARGQTMGTFGRHP